MYKALDSFTTKDYDVRRGEILAEDFTTQDEITEFLNIGYIEEFNGSIGITQNGTYDVTDYEQAVVNVGGGGGSDLDWTALGYEERPQAIDVGYDYALEIKNNWVPVSDLSNKFQNDYKLTFMPLVDTSTTTKMSNLFQHCYGLQSVALLDTSNVTLMNNMFYNCYSLKDLPLLNTSKVTGLGGIFSNCHSFTDKSLNNILQMCINATSYTATKTLYQIGLRSTDYPVERIQALPSYQDFIDAGWTIGY